jgi:hypothetical protein
MARIHVTSEKLAKEMQNYAKEGGRGRALPLQNRRSQELESFWVLKALSSLAFSRNVWERTTLSNSVFSRFLDLPQEPLDKGAAFFYQKLAMDMANRMQVALNISTSSEAVAGYNLLSDPEAIKGLGALDSASVGFYTNLTSVTEVTRLRTATTITIVRISSHIVFSRPKCPMCFVYAFNICSTDQGCNTFQKKRSHFNEMHNICISLL